MPSPDTDKRFTLKDIRNALRITPYQAREWVKRTPPFNLRQTTERVAQQFTAQDLIFFSVIQRLVQDFGISLSVIAQFSHALYDKLPDFLTLRNSSVIYVSLPDGGCYGLLDQNQIITDGIVIDLAPSKEAIVTYLGISSKQAQLDLGLLI
ncbi:MAG: hypothetical protein MI976_28115 [Pseudomonadales bacterium]|nr:hypothetical protein [Pseudomonadales bacterium]